MHLHLLLFTLLLACWKDVLAIVPTPGGPQKNTPVKMPEFTYPEIFDGLEGAVSTEHVVQGSSRLPSLASVHKLPMTDFKLSTWPSEACQVVKICPIPAYNYEEEPLKFNASFCEQTGTIVYYTHEHRISVKTDSGWTNVFYQLPMVALRYLSKDLFYVQGYAKYEPFWTEWTNQTVTEVQVKYTNVNLLVVTNSRYCHPLLMEASSLGDMELIPKFDKVTNKDMLMSYTNEGITSYLDFAVANDDVKTFDIFPEVAKRLPTMQKTNKLCTKVFLDATSIKVTPGEWDANLSHMVVWQYKLSHQKTDLKPLERSASFMISHGDCEWVRLWFTDTPDITKAKFELTASIDILLQAGIIIPSDNNKAREIIVSNMRFTYFRFRILEDISRKFVQLSYGWSNFNVMFYQERMLLSFLEGKSTFYVNLIKPARCQAAILQDKITEGIATNRGPVTQVLEFTDKCVVYVAKDPSE